MGRSEGSQLKSRDPIPPGELGQDLALYTNGVYDSNTATQYPCAFE